MSDVWNNVTVYGQAWDIEHFKQVCFDAPGAIQRAGQSGWDGCRCTLIVPAKNDDRLRDDGQGEYMEEVWNFQPFIQDELIEYSFSFDTDGEFPTWFFEHMADRFPNLAFDCACIGSLDEFMGFGWFNPPSGGEAFQQDYEVPEDYWTGGGGHKRTPAAEAEHGLRVDKLMEGLRQSSLRLKAN